MSRMTITVSHPRNDTQDRECDKRAGQKRLIGYQLR